MWNLQDNELQETDEQIEELQDTILEGLVPRWRFFAPSRDLTKDVLRLNDELGEDYFNRADQIFTIGDQDQFKDHLRQASEIILHSGAETPGALGESDEGIISSFQALLSERVFNHLAMLARNRPGGNRGSFSIREELTKELAEKIGLGLYLHEGTTNDLRTKAEAVLLRLAGEFQRWLIVDYGGVFMTTWGLIRGIGNSSTLEADDSTLMLIPDVDLEDASATGP